MLGFASSTSDNSDLVGIETTFAERGANPSAGLCTIPPLATGITIDVIFMFTGIGSDKLIPQATPISRDVSDYGCAIVVKGCFPKHWGCFAVNGDCAVSIDFASMGDRFVIDHCNSPIQ